MKKIMIAIILGVIALVSISLVMAAQRGSTPPIRDHEGNLIPQSIASLEKVPLGGMDQWILVRGQDASNPVLLWLHGGPGAAQISVARNFNGALEKDFVVVHWDQRGAGKSNPPDFDEQTMSFQQFIDDGYELTQYLKSRFDQEKIYLVGHSWGTQFGIQLAQAYPEDYHAYVGVSQFVSPIASQETGHAWLMEQIKEAGNEQDLDRLEKLGSPPFREHQTYVAYAQMINVYGGNFDVGMGRLAWIALRVPEYTPGDMLAWLRGANRGSGPMWDDPEYQSFNAMKDVPQLLLPVYFFAGRDDHNTPLQVTSRYFESLIAPQGKELVIFEESAHTPFFGEPEKFNRELVRIKEETYLK